MPGNWIMFVVGAVAAALSLAGAIMILRWLRLVLRRRTVARGRRMFPYRREWLEARFFDLASRSGKPRGLAWVGCDFEREVVFAREPKTGLLRALVGVAIRFEAVEGGGMEDVEAVGNLKSATAVFHYDGRQWSTDGRAIFNLNPNQAIEHFSLDPMKAEQ